MPPSRTTLAVVDDSAGQPLLWADINSSSAIQNNVLTTPSDRRGGMGLEPEKRRERLVSLDAIRGLTVCFMILVDNVGDAFPSIGHSPWDHIHLADFVMPFFLFMVGCSMSLAFKKYHFGLFKKVVKRTVKLFLIGVLIQGSGFPKMGNPGFDLSKVRIPGILQRIAWAYFCVSCIVLYVPQRSHVIDSSGYFKVFKVHAWQWAVASLFFVGYLVVMLGVTVPDWTHTIGPATFTIPCDKAGDLTPACSATRMVDRWILTEAHMYGSGEFTRTSDCSTCSPAEGCKKPVLCDVETRPECSTVNASTSNKDFDWPMVTRAADCPPGGCAPAWCAARLDPEGILASMPAVFTTFLGYHFGMVLQHFKAPRDRIMQWAPLALTFLAGGLFLGEYWPGNKQIWSPSYVMIMAGGNGLCLAVFYSLLDYTEWQPRWLRSKWRPCRAVAFGVTDLLRPFVWVGMNTIFIYLLSPSGGLWEHFDGYFYWKHPENTLLLTAYRHIFCGGDTGSHGICDGGIFDGHDAKWAVLIFTVGRIGFWTAVAGILHYHSWYWAL